MNQTELSRAEFIEVARKLISFDTTPAGNTVEMVQYLNEVAAKFGLMVEVLSEPSQGTLQSNIIVRPKPAYPGEKNFILQAHLDTADPGSYALWKKNGFNPFDASIEEGRIYGVGAAEVKLDFLCKLQALLKCRHLDFKNLTPIVIGTFGEETGMNGALKLFRRNKINAPYALIGETSNLKIINASKGFVTVEIRIPLSSKEIQLKHQSDSSEMTETTVKVFAGRSAHSSTPHLGDSAALKLFEHLNILADNTAILDIEAGARFNTVPHQAMVEYSSNLKIEGHEKSSSVHKIKKIYHMMLEVEEDMKNYPDKVFQPQHSTISIGVIRYHEDYILIGGSCRILPTVQQEIYEKWIQKFQVSCKEIGAEFHLQDYKKPFRTDEKSILIRTALNELEKEGLSSELTSVASTNEASLFSRMGVECICFGAGARDNNIHTPNENVSLEDLEKSINFYERMIKRLCT